jgi:hypothetical protein
VRCLQTGQLGLWHKRRSRVRAPPVTLLDSTEAEGNEGKKIPTEAHEAIARLTAGAGGDGIRTRPEIFDDGVRRRDSRRTTALVVSLVVSRVRALGDANALRALRSAEDLQEVG